MSKVITPWPFSEHKNLSSFDKEQYMQMRALNTDYEGSGGGLYFGFSGYLMS